jgi:hypothetical protein
MDVWTDDAIKNLTAKGVAAEGGNIITSEWYDHKDGGYLTFRCLDGSTYGITVSEGSIAYIDIL